MKKDYIEQNRSKLENMAKDIMVIEKKIRNNEIESQKAIAIMDMYFQQLDPEHLIEAFDFLDDFILKNLDK